MRSTRVGEVPKVQQWKYRKHRGSTVEVPWKYGKYRVSTMEVPQTYRGSTAEVPISTRSNAEVPEITRKY